MIIWKDFEKIDMRVGTVVSVAAFPEARKPAYKLKVDFGKEIGLKKTSAQITQFYGQEDLVGKQVIAVTNFPPKQIGPFMSECLIMGIYDESNNVTLLSPERAVANGSKIG